MQVSVVQAQHKEEPLGGVYVGMKSVTSEIVGGVARGTDCSRTRAECHGSWGSACAGLRADPGELVGNCVPGWARPA